ncbi:MAG: Branched-chain amino acid ABC-type transport system permease component [Thermoleophilia bacterium]|nr:Branched-chain amino acid ABC-type transport system permease component [Thermoleophilia bacterium]
MNLSAAQKQQIIDRTGVVTAGLLLFALLIAAARDPAAFMGQTTIGLTYGATIALIALGYTMVYGIIELINFAHADVFMLGSMMAMQIIVSTGVTADSSVFAKFGIIMVAMFACMVMCAGINVAIEKVAYRPLRNAPPLAPLITAIGMSFIIANLAQKIWGPSQVSVPDLLGNATLFGNVRLKDAFVILMTIPLLYGLNWFVSTTKQGKAMRATAQDKGAAAIMGINVDRTISLTFLLGGLLAGAGGVMYALVNTTTVWNSGFKNGMFAFTAAVLGGIGNLTGAVVGAVMLGLIASYSSLYVGDRWVDVVIFSILVMVLVFRPTGLLGEQSIERA